MDLDNALFAGCMYASIRLVTTLISTPLFVNVKAEYANNTFKPSSSHCVIFNQSITQNPLARILER